jgi:hypothetical protein
MKVQAITNLIYKGTHYFKNAILEIEDRHFAHLQNQNMVTQNIETPAKEEPKTDVSTPKDQVSSKDEEKDEPKDQLDDEESDEDDENDPGEPSQPQAPING